MRQRHAAFFAVLCCAIAMGAGCAGLKESCRGIAGTSTKVLEDGRQNAVKRSYPADYAKCRETVDRVLAENKAYVYARSDAQKMIAFYLTDADTTPVGVFFTVRDESATDVEVSSPSRYAKESIADKIAAGFNEKPALPDAVQPAAVVTQPQEDKK